MAVKNQTTKTTLCCVPCTVQPGMFDNEYLVVFESADPDAPERTIQVQVFVDERLVSSLAEKPRPNQPAKGLLVVELVKKFNSKWALIALPQPAVPVGATAIVRTDDLESVPQ
jgi:hypothetical protein